MNITDEAMRRDVMARWDCSVPTAGEVARAAYLNAAGRWAPKPWAELTVGQRDMWERTARAVLGVRP